MTTGISASDLSDDDLRRELAHLKEKTEDIDSGGTQHQQTNHRSRTAELEAEFLRRNPGPRQQASSSAPEPSDSPTDDPDRPANPA